MNDAQNKIIHAHVAAVTQLLLESRAMKPGIAITGGDPLDTARMDYLARTAFASNTDVVHLEFATNDAGVFTMVGMCLFVPRERACYALSGCQLWLGENQRRALILPQPSARGHFRLSPSELVHLDGKPCASHEEGTRRAHDRMQQLMRRGQFDARQTRIDNLPFQV